MRYSSHLLLLALGTMLFTLGSCKDGEGAQTTTVDVRFRALYNGQPYEMNTPFMFNGQETTFSKLHFYISGLALMKSNSAVELEDIEMVRFEDSNTSPEGAETGFRISKEDVPADSYDGIRFDVGVSPELNAQSPVDYAPDHPLRPLDDYWADWGSYIFSKAEGRFDTTGDGQFDGAFVYHIGSDPFLREVSLSAAGGIAVAEGTATEIFIDMEISNLLKDASGVNIDLEAYPTIHNVTDLATVVADNWKDGFELGE